MLEDNVTERAAKEIAYWLEHDPWDRLPESIQDAYRSHVSRFIGALAPEYTLVPTMKSGLTLPENITYLHFDADEAEDERWQVGVTNPNSLYHRAVYGKTFEGAYASALKAVREGMKL